MSGDHGPVDTARAEAVASLATAMRETVSRHVAAHGPHDPMTTDIVASAIMLLVVELSVNADAALGAVLATMLLQAYAPGIAKPEVKP